MMVVAWFVDDDWFIDWFIHSLTGSLYLGQSAAFYQQSLINWMENDGVGGDGEVNSCVKRDGDWLLAWLIDWWLIDRCSVLRAINSTLSTTFRILSGDWRWRWWQNWCVCIRWQGSIDLMTILQVICACSKQQCGGCGVDSCVKRDSDSWNAGFIWLIDRCSVLRSNHQYIINKVSYTELIWTLVVVAELMGGRLVAVINWFID